jgi:hypothetical protein
VSDLPLELAADLPLHTELGSLAGSGQSLPGAGVFTRGGRPARSAAAGGATTQVFGAQGQGSKFVYVFDRSASMDGFQGRPMAAAKAQMLASLRDLKSVHQFQIIFYNERISVFNPSHPQPPRMMFGTEQNRRLAEEYIRGISPAGGTRHGEPLKRALGLQPDVIFLLTDAEEPQMTPGELEQARRRNRGATSIHTIEFGSGPFHGRDNFLVRLARQNNGQHVYVDVTRLAQRK